MPSTLRRLFTCCAVLLAGARAAALTVFAVAATVLGLAVTPAGAAVDAAAVKAALTAMMRLGQQVPDYKSGKLPLPRLDDGGEGGRLLRAVWNIDAVVAGRPQLAAGTQDLMAWGETANALMKLYVFADDAKTLEAIGANEAKFRKEIAWGSAFSIRMSATTLQGVTAHMATLPAAEANSPVRQAGMKQVAGGIRGQMLGMLGLIGNSAAGDMEARRMAGALADDIELLAAMFDTDTRRELADLVLKAIPVQGDPEVKAALVQFEKACRPQ